MIPVIATIIFIMSIITTIAIISYQGLRNDGIPQQSLTRLENGVTKIDQKLYELDGEDKKYFDEHPQNNTPSSPSPTTTTLPTFEKCTDKYATIPNTPYTINCSPSSSEQSQLIWNACQGVFRSTVRPGTVIPLLFKLPDTYKYGNLKCFYFIQGMILYFPTPSPQTIPDITPEELAFVTQLPTIDVGDVLKQNPHEIKPYGLKNLGQNIWKLTAEFFGFTDEKARSGGTFQDVAWDPQKLSYYKGQYYQDDKGAEHKDTQHYVWEKVKGGKTSVNVDVSDEALEVFFYLVVKSDMKY